MFGQMVPCARTDYPFSTSWPPLEGEPDALLKTMGDVGYWQVVVVLLMMMFNIPIVFHVSSPEVTGTDHKYWCRGYYHKFTVEEWKNLSSVTVKNFRGITVTDPCVIKKLPYLTKTPEDLFRIKTNKTKKCISWDFEKSRESIMSQFSLACTILPVSNVAESVFSLGAAVGGLISSFLADRFGRKKLLMTSQLINVLIGFGVAKSTSYATYLFCRFLLGSSCSAVLLSSFIICVEITGGKWTSILNTVYMYSFSLGYITLFLLSHLFNQWVYLQIAIALIGICLLSIWWMVPESPRWLLTSQNHLKLMSVVETVRDFNRRPVDIDSFRKKMKDMPAMKGSRKEVNPLMLFRGKVVKRLSTVIPFVSFFFGIAYYGLVLNYQIFSLGMLYSGAIEFAAATTVLILGFKNDVAMISAANALSGLCYLAGAALTQHSFYFDIAMIAARFFNGMVNSSLTTIVATMYPTLIRTVGLGWYNFFVSIALAVAANIVLLSEISVYLPLIVLGISSLLASLTLMFIPGRACRDLLDLPEELELAHQEISRKRREAKAN